MKHAGFLDSVAVLYSTQGQCSEAEDFLHRSLALDQSQGRQPAESTQLQLADIWMRERNYTHARDLYSDIVARRMQTLPTPGAAISSCCTSSEPTGHWWTRFPIFRLRCARNWKPIRASSFSRQARIRPAGATRTRFTYCRRRGRDTLPSASFLRAVLDMQTAWTMLAVSVDEPGPEAIFCNTTRDGPTSPSKQREAFEEIYLELERASRRAGVRNET